ncbi:MAG: iron-sulfur cluster assembly accessory protein [Rhodospirillales bacterium]|jgi:iron-sulfur cluster assembly protein|nr:iron-sulfur cluster assembly accessory protein [Gammaproteobacteria bacterium]MYE18348.1 iron-sulfur cluster assembly accessory protein [Rhodospirillales bacterium]
MTDAPKLLTLTDVAAERARAMIAARGEDTQGLRIALKTGGCSGMAYDVEYADEARPTDEVIEDRGVKVFIDPAAVLFLAGSRIGWEESILQSRFTFENPNEVARCGCGESVSFGGAGTDQRG